VSNPQRRRISRIRPGKQPEQLSYWQSLAINWLFPIIIVGMVAPIALEAFALALANADASAALHHGELYLVSANTATCSGALLLASRLDRVFDASMAAYGAIILIALPSYFAWATLSAAAILGNSVNASFARIGGSVDVLLSLTVSGIMAHTSCKA
jgi:hypothetical protein